MQIVIEVVKGGFVLTYPRELNPGAPTFEREVFTSTRKMNQKIKDVLDTLSTTPDDSKE